jgi:hypothetical protein
VRLKLKLGFALCAPLAALLIAGLAAHTAAAGELTYTFEANSTMSLGGAAETITGSFNFNTVTGVFSNDNIILSGTSPYSGTYDEDFSAWDSTGGSGEGGSTGAQSASTGYLMDISWGGAFGSDTIPLAFIGTYNGPGGNQFGTGISGGVTDIQAAPVPEPSTLLLLAGSIAFAGARLRRRA